MKCPSISELPSPENNTGWPWTEESLQLPDTMIDDSSWPRISIVTPSYNQSQFIEETIRSVLLQGYPNLEYIVIDGGSTDGSVDIIKKYERWLAYWVSEPDRGQSHAINKGWQQATGSILAWLNSDDMYMPKVLLAAAKEAYSSPEAGIWHGIVSAYENGKDIKFAGKQIPLAELLDQAKPLGIRQPAAFFNRRAIEKIGTLDEGLHQFMDFDLGMRISLCYPIIFVPQHWARLRIHKNTKTKKHTTLQKEAEKLKLFQKFFGDPNISPSLSGKRFRTLIKAYLQYGQTYLEYQIFGKHKN